MKFPVPRPSLEEARISFSELCNLDDTKLLIQGEWFSRSDIKFEMSNLYIKTNNVGLDSSNYFHFNARMVCDSLNSPSPIRSWFNPKIRKSVESSKFFEKSPRTALALRKYIPSQFRPSAAKCLYSLFNAKRIYDPCGGWGDRLSAFLSHPTTQEYYLRDTNPNLFLGYEEQISIFNKTKKVIFELKGSEIDSPDFKPDFIFTSPPYFNIEKYDGIDSSHKNYKRFDIWMRDFLFKMVYNSYSILETNGHLAINISDVYSGHVYNKICNPLYDYCLTLPNLKFHSCIGYEMRKRLNSKSNKVGVFCEPILIFKKI